MHIMTARDVWVLRLGSVLFAWQHGHPVGQRTRHHAARVHAYASAHLPARLHATSKIAHGRNSSAGFCRGECAPAFLYILHGSVMFLSLIHISEPTRLL